MAISKVAIMEGGSLPMMINVPLFKDGGNQLGITVAIYKEMGEWSFAMEDDAMKGHQSLLEELFFHLCIKAGLRKRITCLTTLEMTDHGQSTSCSYSDDRAMGEGSFLNFDFINHMLATAYIPYWKFAADKINSYDRGKGFDDTLERAVDALFTIPQRKETDDILLWQDRWEQAWNNECSAAGRRALICGNNWRLPEDDWAQKDFFACAERLEKRFRMRWKHGAWQ